MERSDSSSSSRECALHAGHPLLGSAAEAACQPFRGLDQPFRQQPLDARGNRDLVAVCVVHGSIEAIRVRVRKRPFAEMSAETVEKARGIGLDVFQEAEEEPLLREHGLPALDVLEVARHVDG